MNVEFFCQEEDQDDSHGCFLIEKTSRFDSGVDSEEKGSDDDDPAKRIPHADESDDIPHGKEKEIKRNQQKSR